MNPVTNGAHTANPLGKPKRMIVFEYYDGPIEGVIEFGERGGVFRFKMLGVESELSTGGKTRDYVFQPLPADALDRIVIAIEPYIAPTWPVWCPLWRFPSPRIEAAVETTIESILLEAGPAEWQVSSTSATFDDYRAERSAISNESRP